MLGMRCHPTTVSMDRFATHCLIANQKAPSYLSPKVPNHPIHPSDHRGEARDRVHLDRSLPKDQLLGHTQKLARKSRQIEWTGRSKSMRPGW
jgi:hypothetical protein